MTEKKSLLLLAVLLFMVAVVAVPVSAATTEVTITKLASDDTTVLDQKTVTWQWMKDNLPVLGDGETTYYNQGPVFEDAWKEVHPGEQYDGWNPTEDVNLVYKDHGEFMGTDVKDLCNLVGGAEPEDLVEIKAYDGLSKKWPAKYIYTPNPRQGPMVIAWYHGKDTGYVDEKFREGMRLYFFGETTNEQGMHVWGNWDMHESWDEEYWYYYNNKYPSASGNSVQVVNKITIHSDEPASSGGSGGSGGDGTSKPTGFTGSALSVTDKGTVNGTVQVITSEGGFCTLESGDSCTIFLNTTGIGKTSGVRLYLFGTNNTGSPSEDGTDLEVSLGNMGLRAEAYYTDDAKGRNPAVETWRYALKTLPSANHTLHVRNTGEDKSSLTLSGGVLVVPLPDTSGNRTSWWIAEGADVIQADPASGVSEDDACTTADFTDPIGQRDDRTVVALSVVSTGAAGNDTFTNRVVLNGGEWTNLLSGGEDAVSIGRADATPYLRDAGNKVEIASIPTGDPGDYIENRIVLLAVTRMPVRALPVTTATVPPTETTTTVEVTSVPVTETETSGDLFSGIWAMIAGWFGIGGDEKIPAPAGTGEKTDVPTQTPAPLMTPSATHATVTVITHPAGAQVFQDGVYTGLITPASLSDLPTGDHILRIELENYRPYETAFDLDEDTDVAVSLEPCNPNLHVDPLCLTLAAVQGMDSRSGGIYVEASDDGADIYIDNKKIDVQTPQVVNGLKEGLHRVKVKKAKASYAVDTKEVCVSPGVVVPVRFDRSENAIQKTLTVDVPAYKGAPCSVNGYYTGKKVPATIKFGGLNSFVSFSRNGSYISVPISNFAEDGSTLTLQPVTDGLTSLRVDSTPQGAEIFVDGFDTGRATPYTVENVSPGRHRVMLAKPGYLPKEDVVLVPKGSEKVDVKFMLASYASGSLYVNSTPDGAKIYLYGQNTGEVTPHLFTGMDIGVYSVKVVGRSDSRTVDDVLVRPGEVTECKVRLRR
ncbi:MAG: PEGA domain-containing protein [Methanofollis sp.]|uniref:PEGA domain-containing protein n=1 Tax=Methanofollis sp. TaxID=2052835 RepID=UPI002612962F|nr:PEGA domain-containing protein [Methanofollis sp.]MDD4254150.1 PEGA domain-containing protein [Methanofollis sp.]